jgi:hypothetical protein
LFEKWGVEEDGRGLKRILRDAHDTDHEAMHHLLYYLFVTSGIATASPT